ncbi:MAG: 16S rRNA (guanine(527)-N(7))-methyltransferase RsmG [Candidatus Margulisiibacteriota bacterium]
MRKESYIFQSDKLSKFDLYSKELLDWNSKFNLTSITDENAVKLKHFEDSKALAPYYDFYKGPSVIDVGSGAGFPGLPLKILFPQIKLTLLEATKKKTEFLKHISMALGFSDVEVIWGRAEDADRKRREEFDVAVCRALGPLNVACELCLPFVKQGGVFLAMKGPNAQDEIKAAGNALNVLRGSISKIEIYTVGDNSRTLIIISKTGKTPAEYPRRAGIPKKNPL